MFHVRSQFNRFAVLCAAVAGIRCAQTTFGATQYSITNIGAVVGTTTSTARSINNNGDVVGEYGSTNNSFLFSTSSGTFTNLSTAIGTTTSTANSAGMIGDDGTIVGRYTAASTTIASTIPDGYIYSGGVSTAIATPNSGKIYNNNSIAPLGDINAGDSFVTSTYVNSTSRAIVNIKANGSYSWTVLDPLGTGTVSYGKGINDSNTVVGNSSISGVSVATKWTVDSSGNWTAVGLSALVTGKGSVAYDINNNNISSGYSVDGSNFYHAVLWKSDNSVVDLGYLTASASYSSYAAAVNDQNVAVGASFYSGTTRHAFMAAPDASGNYTMVDLNTLIDSSSGWVLNYALDINNAGQIVGYGTYGGQTQAFVLTPTPEPASLILLASGSLLLMRKRR